MELRMPNLLTIGYEGTDIATFLTALRASGVEVLADVRELPLSRKPGFSKSALSVALEGVGIRYRHFRELGDPKAGRLAARAGDYTRFRKIFSAHLDQPKPQDELSSLLQLATERLTCILCFEKCSIHCHRSIIASRAQNLGFNIVNLVAEREVVKFRNGAEFVGRHFGESLSAAE